MKWKGFLLVGLLLLVKLISAQFTDSFTDGNATINPNWNGDTTNYEVDALFQLHLNAPAQTDTSYLSTPSIAINNAIWKFYVKMVFNPSSSNYAKIYLVSDQSNLKKALNGYFVKIGNTTDEISLYRQDGLTELEIIDGIDGRVNTSSVSTQIKVTRDHLGNWQLFSDPTGGTSYILEGSTFDATHTSSSFFGISSKYTSTRSNKFFYDAFNITGTAGVTNNSSFSKKEDIIINEALFNPRIGGVDFVEIYNNSNKYIDLRNWQLANFEGDVISNLKTITNASYILAPNKFATLTKDANNILNEYPAAEIAAFLQMGSLPAYNNDQGKIYLINDLGDIIDDFSYYEDMHFSLLNNNEGVSLERINYSRPSNDITNWHSAAESANFATPGYENSQYLNTSSTQKVIVEPEIFSPDNDGYNDIVNISYNFEEPGFVGNIIIYDTKGRLVKKLVENELLALKGTFSWDGINYNHEKSRIGIYIIYFEAFNSTGKVNRFKKTTVLGGWKSVV